MPFLFISSLFFFSVSYLYLSSSYSSYLFSTLSSASFFYSFPLILYPPPSHTSPSTLSYPPVIHHPCSPPLFFSSSLHPGWLAGSWAGRHRINLHHLHNTFTPPRSVPRLACRFAGRTSRELSHSRLIWSCDGASLAYENTPDGATWLRAKDTVQEAKTRKLVLEEMETPEEGVYPGDFKGFPSWLVYARVVMRERGRCKWMGGR